MRTSDVIITQGRIAKAVVAVVNQSPEGAPSGLLYAPLSPYLSIAEFEAMMHLLTETKRVAKRGDRYYPAKG